MSELVGNHVKGKVFRTAFEPGPKHDTTAAATDRAGTRHPQRPPLAGDKVFERDAKPGVVQEIALDRVGQTLQDELDPVSQNLELGKRLQIGGKDLSGLRVSALFVAE